MYSGKNKALTFSYDDAVLQDQRLIRLFRKYGLSATFNVNSGLLGRPGTLLRGGVYVDHTKPAPEKIRGIYEGFEVAGHTLTHPSLVATADGGEVVRQVEEDRVKLSDLVGYEVRGFAYPGGGVNADARVASLIQEKTGVKFARTIQSSGSLVPCSDLYLFSPTVYHFEKEKVERLVDEFLSAKADEEHPMLLYVWGHSYEFDIDDSWGWFEGILEKLSRHDDIYYGTNSEILLGGATK